MVNALTKELLDRKLELQGLDVETIYFGGGTPSVLDESELRLLLETVYADYQVTDQPEITFEANPDDCTKDNLKMWSDLGINRLSIGVQSFDQHDLMWMNRSHNSIQAEQAINDAYEAGFKDINMDLIYGVPSMPDDVWKANVRQALELPINHISAYSLTVEEGTALHHFVKTGESAPLNDDKAANEFAYFQTQIAANGWQQYEISNYCKSDNYAAHNTNYWRQKSYLGVGPSAHSYDGNTRRWNISNNAIYLRKMAEGEPFWEEEELSRNDKINERIMVGLRTKWGVDAADLSMRFEHEILEESKDLLKEFQGSGWLIFKDDYIKLTPKGMAYADHIASELFVD